MALHIPIHGIGGYAGKGITFFQTTILVNEVTSLLGHDPRSSMWKNISFPEVREMYEKIQRKTDKRRRDSAQKYIRFRMGPESYWIGAFPAISIGVLNPQQFRPHNPDDPDSAHAGILRFDASPDNPRILLDGLGRITAAIDLMNDSSVPEEVRTFVRNMPIPATFFLPPPGARPLRVEELGQLFHDFNLLSTPVSKGQGIDLDRSDLYISLVNRLSEFSLFVKNGGVEPRAARTSMSSKHLAVKAALLKFVRAATEGPGAHVDHLRDEIANPKLTTESHAKTGDNIEDFLEELAGSMGSRFTRRDFIHLSNPGWVALGLVYHDLYVTLHDRLDSDARTAFVQRLGQIDWSPSNPEFLKFLGMPAVDAKGQPVLDETGRPTIGRFYGGAKAFANLTRYLRQELGIDRLLPHEEAALELFDQEEMGDKLDMPKESEE